MKNIWKIALMVAALMTSCSQPDLDELNPNEGANGKEIKFYTEANRTTYFEGEGLGINWEAGDELPIIARAKYAEQEVRKRMQYKAASTGASTTFTSNSPFTWDLDFYEGNSMSDVASLVGVDFFAFHCGKQYSASTTIYNGIKVYSSPVQEQSAAGDYSHIGDYTVLASNKVSRGANQEAPIAFQFTNCMSIVELTLKGDATRKIKSVTLTSENAPLQFEEAFLAVEDFTTSKDVVEEPYTIYTAEGDGTKGILSNSVTVSLYDWTVLSSEGIKLYFVVMPGVHAAGEITLSTTDNGGNTTSVKMGAITFEKNKVYRPSIELANFKPTVDVPDASLRIVGGNDIKTMYGSVNLENKATIVSTRMKANGYSSDMAIYNVPEKFNHTAENTWQTLSIAHSVNPDLDVYVAERGKVYIMVDGQNNTNGNAYDQHLKDNGWTLETARHSTNINNDQDLIGKFYNEEWDNTQPIFYTTSLKYTEGDGYTMATPGYFAIYSKVFMGGETFNVKELVDGLTVTFRGTRVVAKNIEWPVASAEIQKTATLSDGILNNFEEGVSLAANYANGLISTTDMNGGLHSIPAGYIGMKFFAVKRGSSAAPNCRTVTAKVTKSGMLYQIAHPKVLTTVYNGGEWHAVDKFCISNLTTVPFQIYGKWVEAGEEVTTFDYSALVNDNVSVLNYFNTGILLGDLTVKEVE